MNEIKSPVLINMETYKYCSNFHNCDKNVELKCNGYPIEKKCFGKNQKYICDNYFCKEHIVTIEFKNENQNGISEHLPVCKQCWEIYKQNIQIKLRDKLLFTAGLYCMFIGSGITSLLLSLKNY